MPTASINFPSEPIFLSGSFTRRENSPVLRSVFEDGLVKQAARSSLRRVTYTVRYRVTADELEDWDDWFKNDAAQGAKFFNWTNPITQQSVVARIVNGLVNVGPITQKMDHYTLDMEIEEYI